jgi:hypothetical protein
MQLNKMQAQVCHLHDASLALLEQVALLVMASESHELCARACTTMIQQLALRRGRTLGLDALASSAWVLRRVVAAYDYDYRVKMSASQPAALSPTRMRDAHMQHRLCPAPPPPT